MARAADAALERYLSDDGWLVDGAQVPIELDEAAVLGLHAAMVRQRLLDERLLARERRGQVTFHAPSVGQEAAVFGAAWALEPGDWVFPALREAGAGLLVAQRAGEGEAALEAFVAQCLGSSLDPSGGRQLPSHFSWPRGRFVSASTPIASQLPQAVGAAWAARLRAEPAAVMAFLGGGATSESDFHTALDLAARERLPVVFFCPNNQWAPSPTPPPAPGFGSGTAASAASSGAPGHADGRSTWRGHASAPSRLSPGPNGASRASALEPGGGLGPSLPMERQTASASIAVKARAYRMAAARVDGNDVFACFAAARDALGAARAGEGPTLIEALTYRVSPMTAPDDPGRYRDPQEAERWRAKDPVARLEAFCISRGLLTPEAARAVWAEVGAALDAVFARVEGSPGVQPTAPALFEHVYGTLPWHLREQAAEAARAAAPSPGGGPHTQPPQEDVS